MGKLLRINYNFLSRLGKKQSVSFPMDFDWFKKDAASFNLDLCKASAGLAFSVWATEDDKGRDNSTILAETLRKAGFKDILASADYSLAPHPHTIGAVMGRRRIGLRTSVLALAIRGGKYYAEWGGNFLLANSGNHQGFSEVAKKLAEETRLYASKIGGTVFLWPVGFSRGGGVANLLSFYLRQYFPKIFCYCFEPPAGATAESMAENPCPYIFNIIDPSDLVPLTAPESYGFRRYGVDLYYSDPLLLHSIVPDYPETCKRLGNISGELPRFATVKGDFIDRLFGKAFPLDEDNQSVPCSLWVRELLHAFIPLAAPTREEYVKTLQPALVSLGTLVANQEDPYKTLFDLIKDIVSDVLSSANAFKLAIAGAIGEQHLAEKMQPLIEKRLIESNKPLDKATLSLCSARIARSSVALMLHHPHVFATLTREENLTYLLHVHSPEHTLAMLECSGELHRGGWRRVHFPKAFTVTPEDESLESVPCYKMKNECVCYLPMEKTFRFHAQNGNGVIWIEDRKYELKKGEDLLIKIE